MQKQLSRNPRQLLLIGTKKGQIEEGIQKIRPELYGAFGCNRDNFANSLLITRKMHDKKYSRYKQKDILAHKMSISFHPDDNDKLTYEEAERIVREFVHKFFWRKGYEVMRAVHMDVEHIHVHFIVSNYNVKVDSLKSVKSLMKYKIKKITLSMVCILFTRTGSV